MERSWLLNRYRNDRRKLLDFLLSSGSLGDGGRPTSLSSFELDDLDADYVIDRIKSGGSIDASEAESRNASKENFPIMLPSSSKTYYFTISDPHMSGSPPKREPPVIYDKLNVKVYNDHLHAKKFSAFTDGIGNHMYEDAKGFSNEISRNSLIDELPLPELKTGLFEEDFREIAYELLLASVAFRNTDSAIDDRPKEKSSKIFTRLKSKAKTEHSQASPFTAFKAILNTARIQMQISEQMDACIRRNLAQLVPSRKGGKLDIPIMSLGLLNGTFQSDFHHGSSYMKWKIRQAHTLEEFLCFSLDNEENQRHIIRSTISIIRDSKEWDMQMSARDRISILASIKQEAVKRSSLVPKCGMEGETYYWTAAYHLNFRIYQKLLFGVFDVLEEGQLIEEEKELISLMQMTWSTLGVTKKVHHLLYAWVLFQQYISTNDGSLLEHSSQELQNHLFADYRNDKEKQYMKYLICSMKMNDKLLNVTLPQGVFLLIGKYCGSVLQNYNLSFSQNPSNFQKIMALVSVVGLPSHDGVKLIKLKSGDGIVYEIVKSYVRSSIESACNQIVCDMDIKSKHEGKHPVALLAIELKLLAEREFQTYYPTLKRWCPESLIIVVGYLHKFFRQKLEPCLKEVSSLSDEPKSILASSSSLDFYLHKLYDSAIRENSSLLSLNAQFSSYKIEEVSKQLILDWVISQHNFINEWIGRAFAAEHWEPVSRQQRHAASIVDLFGLLEEVVSQFSGLNLPIDISHLQAILSVVFHSLDAYLSKIDIIAVDKKRLIPSTPPLTRYTDSAMPSIRKKVLDPLPPEENIKDKFSELTLKIICVKLNTLNFTLNKVEILEEGIRNCWDSSQNLQIKQSNEEFQEAVDALFSTTIDIIKDASKAAIDKLIDFAGTRVVFWDQRETFLSQLYRHEVCNSRLEKFLPLIDKTLDEACGLIDETLRDQLVLSICRAFMEGFVWVLLDGGPSRAFSDSDVVLMQDDIKSLKDFFVAEGEGLPNSLVEKQAGQAHHILELLSLKTESIIKMLMKEGVSDGQSQTLLRVLCHRKDREASKFLKKQYDLPMSSDYDDAESSSKSPFLSDLIGRTSSLRLDSFGSARFSSIKSKMGF